MATSIVALSISRRERTARAAIAPSTARRGGRFLLLLMLAAVTAMTLASAAALAQAGDPSYADLRAEAGDDFDARIEDGLVRSGTNRPAIEAFLDTARSSGDARRRVAAEFLVANMPTVDLASLTAADLNDNLNYAFAAVDTLPWARNVPFNLFLHYVLPHRVTQEKFEPWRPAVYTELASALAGCETMVDAAVAVNYWCGARVGFKQTEFRDQNFNSTIRAGYGRCEEMMIVAIAALRAMGLPARPCSAPWWVTTDNNHAWVEVWADGHWYYMGGCEPAAALDRGWFNGAAQRAGIVVSRMFGDPDMFPTGEVVARHDRDSAIVNSTSVYARTGEVELRAVDAEGRPVAGAPAAISAFNFGAFRSLLTGQTDESGSITFVAGLGEYFYTVGHGDAGRAHAVIRTEPGERTVVTMQLEPGAAPPDPVVLRYPTPQEAAEQAALRDKNSNDAVAKFRPELPANPGIDRYEAGKHSAFDARFDAMAEGERSAWSAILTDALGNWRELADAAVAVPDDQQDELLAFLQMTTHLDRIELTTEIVLDHMKALAGTPVREGVGDARFRNHVLNPRIDLEHITAWRGPMSAFARDTFDRPTMDESVAAVNRFTATELRSAGRSAHGPIMNPGEVLVAGHADGRERTIFAVGALRTLGIPARKELTRNRVEWHDGTRWRSFDPAEPPTDTAVAPARVTDESTENEPRAVASTPADVPQRGVIRLSLSSGGKAVDGGFSGFDISRFGNGQWNSLRDFKSEFDGWTRTITLPAGEFLLTAGVRNGNGDPQIRTRVVVLEPGAEVDLEWDLQPPSDSALADLPVVRPLPDLASIRVPGNAFGSEAPISLGDVRSSAPDAPLVVFLFTLDNEPSKRLFGLLRDAAPRLWTDQGARIIALRLPDATGVSTDDFAGPSEGRPFVMIDVPAEVGAALGLSREEAGSDLRFTAMPSVFVVDVNGNVPLWIEGYHLNLVDLIEQALLRPSDSGKRTAAAEALHAAGN